MALKKGEVPPLDKLRGDIWVKKCMHAARAKTLMALFEQTQTIVTMRELWSKYRAGTVKPTETSVKLLEKQFPGTASVWLSGPFGLPLWDVLNKDKATCDAYLRAYLSGCQHADGAILNSEDVSRASLGDCVLGLLQQFLPKDLWRRLKEVDIQLAVDELYDCRRRLNTAESDSQKHSDANPSGSDTSVLDLIAETYHLRGLIPPWEEDEQLVEGVNDFSAGEHQATIVIPIDLSSHEFLSAFDPVPGVDDAIRADYESSPTRSLQNVPGLIKRYAYSLAWARLPVAARYTTFSLGDLLVLEPNPLAAICQRHFVAREVVFETRSKNRVRRYDGQKPSTPNLFRYDTLLAFIAAIFLCRVSRQETERKAADFLWEGVELAIERQFNSAVYDLVKP